MPGTMHHCTGDNRPGWNTMTPLTSQTGKEQYDYRYHRADHEDDDLGTDGKTDSPMEMR